MREIASTADVPLRPPAQVMRLARMGSMHQSRLSFMRILLRRMKAEGWRIERPRFEIDAHGVGTALYRAVTPTRSYTLVAFGHDLPDEKRSDRVIADAWDATFALFDGAPTDADVEQLRANVPLQEAGRTSERVLTLSRANRSVRLFGHVIEALAAGHQPEAQKVAEVGYLMRTTAVYGSGKFGNADREVIADRPEMAAPFQAEMLTVYLIRCFVLDLVEHMARARSASAVPLEPSLRRRFGIGNSTGLGMAPFLIHHPALINNWMAAREEALARVRSVETASAEEIAVYQDRLARAIRSADDWNSAHPLQIEKLAALRPDLDRVVGRSLAARRPWDDLYQWAEAALSLEGQEALLSLMLEAYPDLVDGLADCMSADEAQFRRIDGAATCGAILSLLGEFYGWADGIDWDAPQADARAWYVSAEKLEPRLGERHEEPIAKYEQPLSPARDAALLGEILSNFPAEAPIAEFLLQHPEHRHMVRRLQLLDRCPYGEVRDNTIAHDMLPIDLLRCKLSFFGAGHFDPRSDRWVRINMFQGAPFPHEIAETGDDWVYPSW
ncbi:hypothetical protein AIOL_000984 [Candidatus Rhodobacter oscarellae]|uniref:Uncharacterized protein n=1 Tax=Candidatus Rhodobacter oscarellae TaxID=1675527 RepID=A0A0J9EGM5_9RHOB|nr:hypothetical protein [Candidatus Rhodobacter lobularis]KMW60819.1 hypothetical protein AIOL_000984 [Candidatus Rhodobacter lobularis]